MIYLNYLLNIYIDFVDAGFFSTVSLFVDFW